MKFIRDEKTKNYFLLITYAIVLAYVFLNLDTVWNVVVTIIDLIKPFIIGICIAFVLNIPMKFFEEKVVGKLTKEKSKLRRPLSLIITIVVLVGLIIGLMTFVIPQLAESCSTLVKNVPEYVDSLEKFMNKNINSKELLSSDVIEEVYNKNNWTSCRYNSKSCLRYYCGSNLHNNKYSNGIYSFNIYTFKQRKAF